MVNKKPKLKPCPFCGGTAELYQSRPRIVGHNEMLDDVGVHCTICGVDVKRSYYAGSDIHDREDDSISKWNSRI